MRKKGGRERRGGRKEGREGRGGLERGKGFHLSTSLFHRVAKMHNLIAGKQRASSECGSIIILRGVIFSLCCSTEEEVS